MKNRIKIKASLVLVLCMLFLMSCEKSEVSPEVVNVQEQEGFMSTTGQSDTVLESNALDGQKPLLHMHFDGDLSKSEAIARFDEAVAEYKRNNINQVKSVNSQWIFKIQTFTGTEQNNQTDGTVKAAVYFETNINAAWHTDFNLDNPGNDREGGWDFYLFGLRYTGGQTVSWVEVKSATIQLQGMDGWYLRGFDVIVHPWDQDDRPATGRSIIVTNPDVWLDNESDSAWDLYGTYYTGRERLTFN